MLFSVPSQPRPKGSRAHISLGLAPGVSAVDTGLDALRLVDADLIQRPDIIRVDMPAGVIREVEISSPDDASTSDYAFYYQFNVVKDIRLIYSAYY